MITLFISDQNIRELNVAQSIDRDRHGGGEKDDNTFISDQKLYFLGKVN